MLKIELNENGLPASGEWTFYVLFELRVQDEQTPSLKIADGAAETMDIYSESWQPEREIETCCVPGFKSTCINVILPLDEWTSAGRIRL